MSAFRDRIGAIDPCTWPAFDHQALSGPDQAKFCARRLAIEHYLAGAPLRAIEQRTGVHRRQLYRCLDRCLMSNEVNLQPPIGSIYSADSLPGTL